MNSLFRGLFFGAILGLLFAPMRGQELRQLIGERINEFRGYVPESGQLDAYRQQVTDRVSQTAGTLKDYAQQAASTVKSSADNLSNIAQNAASTVKSTGQDVADTTKRTVNSSNNGSTL
jgi:gas vesicle protein